MKIVPTKKLSFDFESSTQENPEEYEVIEETPVKEDEILSSDIMAREIQRLSLRLRSSTPCKNFIQIISFFFEFHFFFVQVYDVPVLDNQSSKPATLHLSQVVNRVSRCNYVLRRYVREAQKYSPKQEEIRPITKPFSSLQSHESILII